MPLTRTILAIVRVVADPASTLENTNVGEAVATRRVMLLMIVTPQISIDMEWTTEILAHLATLNAMEDSIEGVKGLGHTGLTIMIVEIWAGAFMVEGEDTLAPVVIAVEELEEVIEVVALYRIIEGEELMAVLAGWAGHHWILDRLMKGRNHPIALAHRYPIAVILVTLEITHHTIETSGK